MFEISPQPTPDPTKPQRTQLETKIKIEAGKIHIKGCILISDLNQKINEDHQMKIITFIVSYKNKKFL